MDTSGLTTLRKMVHEAKTFSDVWDYFLTNFGENPEFMSLGEDLTQTKNIDFLIQALTEVGRQLFAGKSALRLVGIKLRRIPEAGFIHGTLFMEGRLTSVMYFEEIHKGIFAILWDPPETKFVRFTGRALYQGLNRSDN